MGKRDRFIRNVLYGRDRGFKATLARAALTPLAWLHQGGLEAYLLPYRLGLRKRYRLVSAGKPVPVIAIGNLSSGGTGKTPMALLVASHLRERGQRVVLLSRGHGGSGESGRAPRIVSDGARVLLTPAEAGDEPVLLANGLPGVPVVVGRDRRASGRRALADFAPEVIVLDDALQYWQLHRDLDIVLLDARLPFDNGWVLPRGLLREPPSHLARAGIVVLTRADRAKPEALAAAMERVKRLAPRAAVFTATHAPVAWIRASDGTALPLDAFSGKSVAVFSGIADGSAFVRTVEALGAVVDDCYGYGDHHAYTAEDIGQLAEDSEATVYLTTEKDLVKVGPLWPEGGPDLYALRIEMRLNDEAGFFSVLDRMA